MSKNSVCDFRLSKCGNTHKGKLSVIRLTFRLNVGYTYIDRISVALYESFSVKIVAASKHTATTRIIKLE